jgi:hypothetical protein
MVGVWWPMEEFWSVLRQKRAHGGRVPEWLDRLLKLGLDEIDVRLSKIRGAQVLTTHDVDELRTFFASAPPRRMNRRTVRRHRILRLVRRLPARAWHPPVHLRRTGSAKPADSLPYARGSQGQRLSCRDRS